MKDKIRKIIVTITVVMLTFCNLSPSIVHALKMHHDVDITITKSYDEKENSVTLTVEDIVKSSEDIQIESILNPNGEEIYDKETKNIKNKIFVVSENNSYEYTMKYKINEREKDSIKDDAIYREKSADQEASDMKEFQKIIEVNEIKTHDDTTISSSENSLSHSLEVKNSPNMSFLAEIQPDVNEVDGNVTSEYNYIIKYKIPPFHGQNVYIEIKLNGNIALKDNVALAPSGLTFISYDKESNIIKFKVNENLSTQEITGNFNVPINFINAQDGDKATAQIMYKDDAGELLVPEAISSETLYRIKYPITISKEKMGSELIFLDGKVQYRVRVKNTEKRDLGGFKIIDNLPNHKDIEIIEEAYMGTNKGKKLPNVANVQYDETSKQITATIHQGRRDEYFYLYIQVKYKNISEGEWITNKAELHDANHQLLQKVSVKNKVEKGKGAGKFDKVVSKNTFGYNDTISWTFNMENSGSGDLDKLVMYDDFPYHTRVREIHAGSYNPLYIDPNTKMNIYIKTKKDHKDDYFLYKEVGYDTLTNGRDNIFIIENNYTTDDNYITSVKIEVENVPPGLDHNYPIRIVTKMLPNYEDGSVMINGTVVTNTARFSVIKDGEVDAEIEHFDSAQFQRAYIGNIQKTIVGDIPSKIGDTIQYKIEVTSDPLLDLPRPIIWDDMPENISYVNHTIKIVDNTNDQVVNAHPQVEFEQTNHGILRWKLDEVLSPSQKIVIDLTAKLESVKYTNINKVGLSTKDIPFVMGVIGTDDKTTNEDGVDYDGNGQFGDMYTYDQASFDFIGGLNISSEKYIKDGTTYKDHATFSKGERIDYKLVLGNNSKTNIKDLVIYDNLPSIGDKDTLYDKDRLSEFNVYFIPDSIKITTNENTNVPYNVFYSTSLNPERVDTSGNGVIGDGVWETNIANRKDIKAIKFDIDPQFTLSSGEELIIEYSVDIPEDTHGVRSAYNNFSVVANGLYPIVSNTVEATVRDYEVVLIKVDADDNNIVLEGAEFKLLDANNVELQAGLITDENGRITVENLKPGIYKFVETKAPEGYVLNETPIEFEIVNNQLHLTVENIKKPGSVVLTKVDADDNNIVLEGAEFKLLDANNVELQTGLITDGKGQITVENLKPGIYKFIETKAPEGYILNEIPIEFEIVKNQQTELNLTVENVEKPGNVVLTKVDADDNGLTLEGAEFKLLDANNVELQTGLITDGKGQITVENLKPGIYKFVETKAPEGYILNETPIEFEIVKNQQTELNLTVENVEKPGSVVLTKVDADDNNIVLEGAEFKLLDANNVELQTGLTTDGKGQITVENLKPGIYKFVETKAPEGYILNETPIEFEIVKNQQTELNLTVENVEKPGSVVLTKVDADDNGLTLEGAEFKLLDANNVELQIGLITDGKGKITVENLKPGIYKFVETKAPEGYILNETPIEFEIVKNQQTELNLTVENVEKPGSVVLTKVDADDNNIVLEGAEFKLLDANNVELQTGLITDGKGQITVENLKPGIYKFVETKAPEGYILNETPIEFEIVKNQQTELNLTIENVEKPGSVVLTKVDTDDNNIVLEGAEFKLLDANNVELQTGLTTDGKGKITVENLKPGIYKFVETKAPEGYILNETPIEFEIVKNQQAALALTVKNTLKKSILTGGNEDKNDNITMEKLPQTGDVSHLGLLSFMFAGSGGMLFGLNRKKRKK